LAWVALPGGKWAYINRSGQFIWQEKD